MWLAGHNFQHRSTAAPQRAKHGVAFPSPSPLTLTSRCGRRGNSARVEPCSTITYLSGRGGARQRVAVKACPRGTTACWAIAPAAKATSALLMAPPRPHLTVMRIHIVNEMKRERKSEPSANEMKPRKFGSDCCLGRAGKTGGHEDKAGGAHRGCCCVSQGTPATTSLHNIYSLRRQKGTHGTCSPARAAWPPPLQGWQAA